ncbi:oxidoreductase, 2(OG)-Fe(II) oxygenase family protein [Nitzschia inconspicua]|uniref:Oxidoreductase, 2(OG)-Fe(II) oxygenase family protein n=1 Tax=Nitzschia inconspicua TaxID=303405 RepID=A0A9K3L0U6_9STRA|nr:oxidoreductase, 2(OG)-Fe(II) oxygenase family protein [Nitzschia inconspicua]
MAKKRKTTLHASERSKDKETRSSCNNKLGSSNTLTKPRFERFPLHLLPAIDSNNKTAIHPLKLQELHPRRVWIVPSFFSPIECRNWVTFCETSGGLEYTAHPATSYIAHRECFRMQQYDAVELATRIFQRISQGGSSSSIMKRLQQESSDLCAGRVPIGCNPNLRLYKYDQGHSFGKHVDGSNVIGPEGGKLMQGCSTEMTMLIYLSECAGGATRFHTTGRSKGRSNKASSFAFEPQVGTLLLHVHGDHCLEHEADPVLGGIKYVLRTDLVYSH